MDFKEAWRHTPVGVRWALSAMLGLGVIIAVAGVFGDYHHFWVELSFVPNLLTSITGFLIGVPVAFFVLSTVIEQREDRVEREAINTLTEQAWDEFINDVKILFADDLIEALEKDVPRLVERASAAVHALADQSPPKAFSTLASAADDLEPIYEAIQSKIIDRESFEKWWVTVVNRWQLINNQVRIRRLEQKMPSMARVVDRSLVHLCASEGSPMFRFYSSNRVTGGDPLHGTVYAVNIIIARFRHCALSQDEEYLRMHINRHMGEIKIALRDYPDQARAAFIFASSMRTIAALDVASTYPAQTP